MHAIIRTTIVAPLIRLRVRRVLPIAGEVITGIGHEVDFTLADFA